MVSFRGSGRPGTKTTFFGPVFAVVLPRNSKDTSSKKRTAISAPKLAKTARKWAWIETAGGTFE